MSKSNFGGLGRGLEALMGPISEETDVLTSLALDVIDPNPDQPRKKFDPEKLQELADSIREMGVLSPILVWQEGGRYTIIAGERRWRAARLAGLDMIPAIVREYDAVARMKAALIENLQRDDLNPIEEAAALKALMDECALTQEQAAQSVGKSRSTVANLLRLLSLDDRTLALLRDGLLSEGHARALLAVADAEKRFGLAQAAVKNGWSVRRLEEEVRFAHAPAKKPAKPDAELKQVQQLFRRTFGARITAQGTRDRGKITLHYSCFEELERIYEILNPEEA